MPQILWSFRLRNRSGYEGPYVRIESVKRISTTEAEVTFKSSEPGKYSYDLVESGGSGFKTANLATVTA